MFENFNVSGLYILDQAVLSLYSTGRLSGCAVDIGHGKIDIAPVVEGAVLHSIAQQIPIGGKDLTQLLAKLVSAADRKRGLRANGAAEQNDTGGGVHTATLDANPLTGGDSDASCVDPGVAEQLKEKYGAVAEDRGAYVRMTSGEAEPLREEHTLPDGQVSGHPFSGLPSTFPLWSRQRGSRRSTGDAKFCCDNLVVFYTPCCTNLIFPSLTSHCGNKP
jgi:hypothetical protein